MLSEPMTLYKLMILHMLKQVKFPLSGAQMSDFFLTKEYTNYFTLQQALAQLQESGLITAEQVRNTSRYSITREGEETLSFFGGQISNGVVEDIRQFLNENKVHLREEVSITADYTRTPSLDYNVHCELREGNVPMFAVDVSVPAKSQAEAMCFRWKEAHQDIYAYVMNTLMKEKETDS